MRRHHNIKSQNNYKVFNQISLIKKIQKLNLSSADFNDHTIFSNLNKQKSTIKSLSHVV